MLISIDLVERLASEMYIGTGGVSALNIVFGILAVVLVLCMQKEHAIRCYVLPLQRNAARLFNLAPTYSFFILLTAYVTSGKPVWDVFMAIVDGYALYCFFGLVILGAGGESRVVTRLAAALPKVEDDLTVNGAVAQVSGIRNDKLKFSACLCVSLQFESAQRIYTFLQLSVKQVMISRPILLAASSICDRLGHGVLASIGERGFRILSLLVLVYAVMTIGRTYHLLRQQIWPAFNPVAAFMVVKGFILLITMQDFVIAMIFSARDPHYVERSTRAALAIYSLVVSIESILYLIVVRQFLKPRIFQSYSTQSFCSMTISFWQFLEEVYTFSNVLGGDLPSMQDKGSSALSTAYDAAVGIEMST